MSVFKSNDQKFEVISNFILKLINIIDVNTSLIIYLISRLHQAAASTKKKLKRSTKIDATYQTYFSERKLSHSAFNETSVNNMFC